jgi:hypothetical protein
LESKNNIAPKAIAPKNMIAVNKTRAIQPREPVNPKSNDPTIERYVRIIKSRMHATDAILETMIPAPNLFIDVLLVAVI